MIRKNVMWSEDGVMRSLKYGVLNENKLDPSFFPSMKYVTLRHNSSPHQISRGLQLVLGDSLPCTRQASSAIDRCISFCCGQNWLFD